MAEEGKSKSASEERRYSVEELADASRTVLGVSPHAVHGALSGDQRKTWTQDEAQKRVDKFLGASVEPEGVA